MERETLNKVIQAIAHEDAECPLGNPFLDLVGSFAAIGAIRETAESFRLYAPLYPKAAADIATRAVDEIMKRYLAEHQGIEDWRIVAWRDRNPKRFEHLRASFRLTDDFQSELAALACELRAPAAEPPPRY
ncbi:MAG: hypothetical protein QOG66_2306 [Methylobacteriaceae bacterium]|jgi:hypothetical protein|nr:hypothetical protein [Methylobacteriaceae bacterium]